MSDNELTIYNPQQIPVTAVVYLPGKEVQSQLLAAGDSWVIADGVTSGQWAAFFDPETGQLLAAALLPDQSTMAQLLLDMAIEGLLRLNPQEPLTATNGLEPEVTARLYNVGAATPQIKTLASRGQHGSSASFPYAEQGQWLGFYDGSKTYITGTWANSFSEVTLKVPRQVFVIGTPYPVGLDAVPQGRVRLTVPAVGDTESDYERRRGHEHD